MSRLMSVALTQEAVRERRKTVSRRLGWTFLKPGDTLTLCAKVQGRRRKVGPGVYVTEALERIAEVEVVSVRRESLALLTSTAVRPEQRFPSYGQVEVAAEGFPGLEPAEFVSRYFTRAQGIHPSDVVTRIEWKYLT